MEEKFNKRMISLIRKNKCVYDPADMDYRNRTAKVITWRRIAQDLKTKDTFCKKRWKSLRDSYKRWKRSEKRASDEEKPYHKFKYADDMAFLDRIRNVSIFESADYDYRFEDEEEGEENYDDGDSDNGVSWPPLPSPNSSEMEDIQNEYVEELLNENTCNSDDKVPHKLKSNTLRKPKAEMTQDTSIQPDFMEVNTKTAENKDNEITIGDPLIPRNPTSLLFESLAQKIISAGLPQIAVDAIELKLAKVVYDEIAKARRKYENVKDVECLKQWPLLFNFANSILVYKCEHTYIRICIDIKFIILQKMDQKLNKRLIELIRKNNCLFDGASPDYRNRHAKAKIWRKIAQQLDVKDAHCKNRWVSLRDSYKRWKRKEKRSGGKDKTHKFKYADDMAFLENIKSYYIPRDSANTTHFSDEDYTDDDDDEQVNDRDKEDSWSALHSPEYTQMEDKQQANEASKPNDNIPNNAVASDNANPVTSMTENDQIISMQPVFMEVKTAENSDNEVSIRDPLTARNSTSLLFESLARKIISSGMPHTMVDAIELKAVKLVYDEISKARQKRENP
ncbi:uncharacterized protein LOC101449870 [Ceratitis capitata]|nr:uncharacterized protein LOC101449870 [Ceratitis capitata]